jgi:hypothetical protein
MRSGVALLCVAGFFAVVSARAEPSPFVLANYSDGYGVDPCRAMRDACGPRPADSYCRPRTYLQAISFRKVGRRDLIRGERETLACAGGMCGDVVAIECFR